MKPTSDAQTRHATAYNLVDGETQLPPAMALTRPKFPKHGHADVVAAITLEKERIQERLVEAEENVSDCVKNHEKGEGAVVLILRKQAAGAKIDEVARRLTISQADKAFLRTKPGRIQWEKSGNDPPLLEP